MNKKTKLTIIGTVVLLLVMIGLTYAYWLVTRSQTSKNQITASCLDISLTNEQNDIDIPNAMPISDTEGMGLTPYTFTVTNNCNTKIDYQIALESMNISGKSSSDYASSSSIKAVIDNNEAKTLNEYDSVETTISGAYESHKLAMGSLAAKGSANGSATHDLRVWIDQDAPITEQSKVWNGKISVTIGQGVFNPYGEGTLAYDILDNYGGKTAITEIDATTWIELEPKAEESTPVGKTSSYWYGTSYEFNPETGNFKLTGDLVQATLDECRNGTKSCGNYTLKKITETTESNVLYKITSFTSTRADYGNQVYMTTQEISSNNGFRYPTTASETGLYKAGDDLGESYYFKGNPTNNYVKFGTYAEDQIKIRGYASETSTSYREYNSINECNNASSYNKKCSEYKYANAGDPMYWRIVRINGNGTIRLIYDGTKLTSNGTDHTASIGSSAYNTNMDQAKYVGYTYDTSETDKTQIDSTIKGVVDAWYDKYLETNYGKYIADGIFCNDREVSSTSGSSIYYAPYERLENSYNRKPQLTCTNKSDRYTISNTLGNGLLSNPIGLLTADETVFAGETPYNTDNNTCYLYFSKDWWLSTPAIFNGSAFVYHLYPRVRLSYERIPITYEVRPVINLKADVTFTGSGTMDDPYVIVMK